MRSCSSPSCVLNSECRFTPCRPHRQRAACARGGVGATITRHEGWCILGVAWFQNAFSCSGDSHIRLQRAGAGPHRSDVIRTHQVSLSGAGCVRHRIHLLVSICCDADVHSERNGMCAHAVEHVRSRVRHVRAVQARPRSKHGSQQWHGGHPAVPQEPHVGAFWQPTVRSVRSAAPSSLTALSAGGPVDSELPVSS